MFSQSFQVLFFTSILSLEMMPSSIASQENCVLDPSVPYLGNVSVTVSGAPCLKWTTDIGQLFMTEHYKLSEDVRAEWGIGDHNYCRIVPGTYPASCGSSDEKRLFEYCPVGPFAPECRRNTDDPNECYDTPHASDYRGTVAVAWNNVTCQKWSEQTPHAHPYTPEAYPDSGLGDHNYCRNPDPDHLMVWCYLAERGIKEWDYCNIGVPSTTCSHGTD